MLIPSRRDAQILMIEASDVIFAFGIFRRLVFAQILQSPSTTGQPGALRARNYLTLFKVGLQQIPTAVFCPLTIF